MSVDRLLARAAARSEALMLDTFTPDGQGSRVPDGAGGGYFAEAADPAPIKCRKTDPSEREQLTADRMQIGGTAVLVVPLDSPVNEGTTGVYTKARNGQQTRYAVVGFGDKTLEPHTRLIVAPADTRGG